MIRQHPVAPQRFAQVWIAMLLLIPFCLVGIMMMGGSTPPDAFLAFVQASEAQAAGDPILANALREQGRQIIADEAARDKMIGIGLVIVCAIVISFIWMQKRRLTGK